MSIFSPSMGTFYLSSYGGHFPPANTGRYVELTAPIFLGINILQCQSGASIFSYQLFCYWPLAVRPLASLYGLKYPCVPILPFRTAAMTISLRKGNPIYLHLRSVWHGLA